MRIVLLGCYIFFISLCINSILHAEEFKGIKNKTLLETTKSWNNKELPNYPTGHPKITVNRIIFQPKAVSPIHLHEIICVGILLKGELIIKTPTGKSIHLKPGQAFTEVTNTWHYGFNPGKIPAELIFVYVGNKKSSLAVFSKNKQLPQVNN